TPATPVTSVTQPTCSVATGTIAVTVQNAGETYSFDNGASFQSVNSKSGLAAGSYSIIIKSTGSCNSSAASVTIDAQPATPSTPVTSVTQPTCSVATGTITATVQNAGETYSFDNGVSFQSSNIKSGLAAGTYQVIIKSTGSCNSAAASATVNTQPATPSMPVTSVTQPTCSVATGTITVTVQNAGETYSFDNGVGFQSSNSKSGLAAGSYSIIIKSTGTCNSVAASATVNTQPATPSTPVASVTQPTCSVATGTIAVTVQNAGETYSFDNGVSFQSSNIKSGLVAGTYNVIIKSTGNCNSAAASATVDAQPATPSTPVTSVTQPTCSVATGTITATVQNAGETYSFDNGVSFQSSNIKSGLAAGTYQVIIKSTGSCNSTAASATVDAQPATPSTPVASVTQPTCSVATGTITVTVQNAGETYSFDNGVTFQSSNIKSGLTAGTYQVIIQSTGSCNSTAASATVNTQPATPSTPVTSVTQPTCAVATGTITVTVQNAGETYSFDNGANFQSANSKSGITAGTYQVIIKSTGSCNSTAASKTLNPVTDCAPVVVNDVNSIAEDNPVSGNVSINDTQSGGGNNIWSLVGSNGGAAHGIVIMNTDGTYTYTPDPDFNGTDLFNYYLCNLNGDCSQATVTITVTPVNDLPVAVNNAVTTREDTPITNSVANNDIPSGDGGNIWSLNGVNGGAAHGTVTMTADGSYIYTPTTGFFGSDAFTYHLCDVNNDCSTATVNVTVNNDTDGILAVNDAISTNEDSAITGNASSNDTPSSEGGNTWTLVGLNGGATHGIVILAANGSYIYTPDANYNGTDIFTYQLCDLDGDCSVATVTITVSSVNDLPIAVNDISGAREDTELRGSVAGNDTPSGDGGNTWTLAGLNGGAAHSIITMNADGGYTCIPYANYFGSDIFTYKLCDANGDCSTATVTITVDPVNDPPVINASPLAQSMIEDGGTIILDIPGNTTNYDGDVLTTSIVQPAVHGTVTIDSSGKLLYTPNVNYNGVETFTYRVCDNGTPSLCATGTITITVTPVNDAPVAVNDVATIAEDGVLNGTSLLANDSDPEGNTLIINTTPKIGPLFGTLIINSNGTYTYTPAANYNGTDSFTYEVCDNGIPSLCTTATVTITVTSVNDLPVANNDAANAHIDKELNGSVSQNDVTSGDGGNVWSVVTPSSNGTLLFNTDGSYTYTPNLNYSGDDSFTYKLCDANGDCSQAVVTIKVEDAVLPNQVFTPNNDGQNDTFLIPGIELYPNNVLTVYNRWGNVVYQKSGYKNEWDGFSNMTKVGNAPLPIGTYFYVLKYGNQQHKTGFVYLDR
ncbi:MAG: Ig-like domain-containing protein, partial [Mariniphaga sp.]